MEQGLEEEPSARKMISVYTQLHYEDMLLDTKGSTVFISNCVFVHIIQVCVSKIILGESSKVPFATSHL